MVNPDVQPIEHYASGRPKCSVQARRLPVRYQDELPPTPVEVFQQKTHESDAQLMPDVPGSSNAMEVNHPVPESCEAMICDTKKDTYGIFHSFLYQFPSFIPHGSLDFICDSPNFNVVSSECTNWWAGFATSQPLIDLDGGNNSDEGASKDNSWWTQYKNSLTEVEYFFPFPNPSTYLLMNWFYTNSNSKTLVELDHLVKSVILDKDFCPEHLARFCAANEAQRLDDLQDTELSETFFRGSDGWHQTSVEISIPFEGIQNKSESEAPKFKVDSLFYRKPMEVIKAALSDTDSKCFHLYPHKTYWQPDSTKEPERIYSELYNSDVYIEEHERVWSAHEKSTHETVIIALMLWSDSTHLANFGTASLWPIYLFLGNQSKYTWCKPTAFAAHHLAYIPKV